MTMNDINLDRDALDPRATALLDAWFGDSTRDAASIGRHMAGWFATDAARDAHWLAQFGDLVRAAAGGELATWSATPRGRLALILALDQLPRNCYRGARTAFATDAAALAETERGLQRGDDRALLPVERMFFYMPMQHAEDFDVQERAVERFAILAAEAPAGAGPVFDSALQFAKLHRDIVRRFGRFPHRNAILGRSSTDEERAWLAADAPDFGQKRR
jgi:uncharacterized protein (DUF924 family)